MNSRPLLWKLILLLTLFALIGGALSCGEVETRPRAWIDYPRDGSSVTVDTPVSVISHVYAREGVAEVLLSVNGEPYRRDPPPQPGASFGEITQEWLPEEEGVYTLQLMTYDTTGEASNPATISIKVVGEVALVPIEEPTSEPTEEPVPEPTEEPTEEPTLEPTEEPTEEPTLEPTEEPTVEPTEEPTEEPPPPAEEPPPADIRFWADDEEIEAGSCTTVRWHVSNVSAYWVNGQPGAGDDGSFQTCPCQDETHTLRLTRSDGSEQNLSVTIRVSGQCEAPPPPPSEDTEPPPPPPPSKDTKPPPVPSLAKPGDGQELSCRSSQTLVWILVSDESGISGYYVKLERRPSPKDSWQSAGGWGPVSGNQVDVTVECGWYYRWTVLAEDGAGNQSGWSPHSHFSVTLG
jgi:hypothetical protein